MLLHGARRYIVRHPAQRTPVAGVARGARVSQQEDGRASDRRVGYHRIVRNLFLLRVALAATFLVAACSPQQAFSPRLTSDVPSTPTPTPVTASGTRAELSAEEGVAVIVQAFRILLETYVDPVDPPALLRAGWEGFASALPPGQPVPETPAFSGTNPLIDLARFRSAYLQASAAAGGGTEGQAALAHAAVRKMADSLGDCHTAFSDPRQVEEQTLRLRGDARFSGVGIRIKRRPNEPVIVWELLDGGSAARAGIKPGDAILKVDGREIAPLPLDQLAALIRGPEGSQVKLTVERAEGKKIQDFPLKRVSLAEPPVQIKWLPGKIVYLRLHSFSQAGQDELIRAVREFESRDPSGWIVDLRTNGGGELPVLLSLLSKFLKDGPFGYQVDGRGQRSALGPDGSYLARQHPLVVLVSETTSSAAEMFAAAVQHHRVAPVVGTKTAGCLGIGNRFQLPDGSALSVTVSKLLGPDGQELNKAGVAPNDQVEMTRADLSTARDPQLQRALVLLGAGGAK